MGSSSLNSLDGGVTFGLDGLSRLFSALGRVGSSPDDEDDDDDDDDDDGEGEGDGRDNPPGGIAGSCDTSSSGVMGT